MELFRRNLKGVSTYLEESKDHFIRLRPSINVQGIKLGQLRTRSSKKMGQLRTYDYDEN